MVWTLQLFHRIIGILSTLREIADSQFFPCRTSTTPEVVIGVVVTATAIISIIYVIIDVAPITSAIATGNDGGEGGQLEVDILSGIVVVVSIVSGRLWINSKGGIILTIIDPLVVLHIPVFPLPLHLMVVKDLDYHPLTNFLF